MGIWGSFRSSLDPYRDNTASYMPHSKFPFPSFFKTNVNREKCNLRFWKSCSVSLLLFLYWKINSQLLAMPLPYFLPFSSSFHSRRLWRLRSYGFSPHNQKHFHRGSLQKKRAKAEWISFDNHFLCCVELPSAIVFRLPYSAKRLFCRYFINPTEWSRIISFFFLLHSLY